MVDIKIGGSDSLFELDNKQYRKGMYEVYYVTQSDGVSTYVGLRDIYSKDVLVFARKSSEYSVNDQTYSDDSEGLSSLVSDLSELLDFNKGGGGSSEELEYNDGFII